MPRLSAVLAAAAVAASLMAAPAPVAGQVSQAHKALKAGWTKYLSKQFNPAAYGDELSSAAGDAATALAKLGEEAVELRRFFDDAALRVAGEAAGSAQGRELLEAVVRRIDVEGGARVPGAVDDVATSLMIMAKQIDVAKGLNGGAIPSGFKVPDGAAEILEVIQKRTAKQRAAAGGKMYRHPNGDYMSIAENVDASKLVQKLKSTGDELSSAELQQIIDATKTPAASRTTYQKTLMNRYRSYRARAGNAPAAKPKAGKADDGALLPSNEPAVPKKGTKADDLEIREHATRAAKRTSGQIVEAVKRAEFNAQVKATTLIDEMGYIGSIMRDAKAVNKDIFEAVRHELADIVKDGATKPMKAGADDLLDQLRSKSADLDELRKLNGGKLPEGVQGMSDAERSVMKQLEDFFDGTPKPMAKADGNFYTRTEMKSYEAIMEAARSGDWSRVVQQPHGPFLTRVLKHYDTELERSVRRALKSRTAKIPETGTHQYMQYAPYLDWAKVRQVLDAAPVHRNLMDKSTWVQYRSRVGGWYPYSEAAEVERILTGLTKNELELTMPVLSRLRKAVGGGSYVANNGKDLLPGDVILRDALFENNEMLYKVMDPKWDAPVYKYQNGFPEATQVGPRNYPAKYVSPDPAEVAARQAARKADLEKAATETAERVGRSADEMAALVKKADRDGKLAAALFDDYPTFWHTTINSSPYSTGSLNLRAKRLMDGDVYEQVFKEVKGVLETRSRKPMRAAADDMYSALRRKAKNLEDLKAVNKGELPSGVKDMTPAEKEVLDTLAKWRKTRRMKDADGWYYSKYHLERADDVIEHLKRIAASPNNPNVASNLDIDVIKSLMKYGDTELEKEMRRAFEAAKKNIPAWQLPSFDSVAKALTRKPVSNPSNWLLKNDWAVPKLEALAAKVKGGSTDLNVYEVARLRKAATHYTASGLNNPSGTWTVHRVQDIYFMELLEKNRGVLEEVMHPRWDQQVYQLQNGFYNSAMRKTRPYLD